jgi:predicted ester cyclase
MSTDENRAATKRVFDALGKGKLEAAQKVLGTDLKKGAAESAKIAQRALPDLRIELEDLIAEGDKVVARWTASGTHKGATKHAWFGSVKGTGKGLNVTGITILRFENGRVAETWGLTDELGAARQLGLVRKRA